jgi:serine-protein kinase ATM
MSAWNSAARAVTITSTSRSACHFLNVILRLQIIPFSAISETVQNMLLSVELSGPALLTDSSSALMSALLWEKVNENPTHYNSTAERVLNWLLRKWTPSM